MTLPYRLVSSRAMKEYKDQSGNLVREFDYQDWRSGEPFGKHGPGKQLIENLDTGEVYYEYVPGEHFRIIRKEQKRIYEQQVGVEYHDMRKIFFKHLEKSQDQEIFINNEVEKIEFLLLRDKGKNTKFKFAVTKLSWCRKLYQELIVNNNRKYHFITPDGAPSEYRYYIEVEALAQYLGWLRSLPKQTHFDFMQDMEEEGKIPDLQGKHDYHLNRWNNFQRYGFKLVADTEYERRNAQRRKVLSELIEEKQKEELRESEVPTKLGQTKPNFSSELSEIRNSENQFWKGIPMGTVLRHFEIMTITPSKNGKPFLSVEQLISFLKKGFLNDSAQPMQKINCITGEKGFVIKRFYEFYDLATSQFSHPQRKENFIKMFTDCFDNWEPKSIEPFFKPNKTKNNW